MIPVCGTLARRATTASTIISLSQGKFKGISTILDVERTQDNKIVLLLRTIPLNHAEEALKSKGLEGKIVQIPYHSQHLEKEEDMTVIAFQVEDGKQYQVTCPKKFITSASKYAHRLFEGSWNCNDDLLKVDLEQFGFKFLQKQFDFLSEYINNGTINESSEWNLDELQALYTIADYLEMPDLIEYLTNAIINKLKFNNPPWKDCLEFGIKHHAPSIIAPALPFAIGDYLNQAQKSMTQQYSMIHLDLIKQAASITNADKATMLVSEKYYPDGISMNPNDMNNHLYGGFRYPLKYPFPKELINIFPQITSLKLGIYPDSRIVLLDKSDPENPGIVRDPQNCPLIEKRRLRGY